MSLFLSEVLLLFDLNPKYVRVLSFWVAIEYSLTDERERYFELVTFKYEKTITEHYFKED